MTDSDIPLTSLRPYAEGDLEKILEIENRAHVAPWTKANFEGELAKPYSRTWVLTDDETDQEVLGYVVFWDMQESFEILNVMVDLPHRGAGFGRKMVQSVANEALRTGATRLILDVRKSNLPAVALYQSIGFTITQIRKGFYTNGEDAYHMSLSLEGRKDGF